MYNDIINNNSVRSPSKYEAANDLTQNAYITEINSKPLVAEKKEVENPIETEQKPLVEEQSILESFNNLKNNLKFYNEPLKSSYIEHLENTGTKEQEKCGDSCVDNINHILKCEGCSAILREKLDIKSEFNEYIEILMYILFGLFIIAILDKLDKR